MRVHDTVPVMALELKIPPPVVALVAATAMWSAARFDPLVSVPAELRIAAACTVGAAGLAIMLAAVLSFRRARTTINPMHPEDSSKLVAVGVFGVTRNPMYLGMLLLLVAWAVYLAAAWALPGPVLFFAYITRFQIMPEEKALSALFGSSYAAYMAKVRRWL